MRIPHDIRHPLSRSRKVSTFHTPAALTEFLARDVAAAQKWFREHPNEHHRLRTYQKEANNATEEAIANCKRQMLIAMAFEPEPNKKFNKIHEVYSNRFQKDDFGEEEKFDPTIMPNEYLTDPGSPDFGGMSSEVQGMGTTSRQLSEILTFLAARS